jgi:hypothetical protein
MKFLVIVLSFICWPFFQSFAQATTAHNIVTTLDRGDYFFIPKSALANSVEGVIYQDKTLRKVPVKNRPIQIYWSSICNDGYYNLTVTPEQIFFWSSHDNPNPNYLFWVISIDRSYYEATRGGLAKNTPKNLVDLSKVAQAPGMFIDKSTASYRDKFRDLNYTPDDWSDSKRAAYCEAQVKNKLDVYFTLLNSYTSYSHKKLAYPKSDSPKLFSYFKEELIDWLPVKIKRN